MPVAVRVDVAAHEHALVDLAVAVVVVAIADLRGAEEDRRERVVAVGAAEHDAVGLRVAAAGGELAVAVAIGAAEGRGVAVLVAIVRVADLGGARVGERVHVVAVLAAAAPVLEAVAVRVRADVVAAVRLLVAGALAAGGPAGHAAVRGGRRVVGGALLEAVAVDAVVALAGRRARRAAVHRAGVAPSVVVAAGERESREQEQERSGARCEHRSRVPEG